MDVMKIRKDSFQSEDLVEGYTSMIWTERHTQLGDFQLKTPYVAETMDKIPVGSLISIAGSDEVCMVETHALGKNDKGAAELTTVGRSLESFLDNRILTGPWQEPWQIPGMYTVQNALMMFIWNSIVNPHPYEVIRDYAWDHLSRDVIPNTVVTDSTKALRAVVGEGRIDDLQTTFEWWFGVGSLYTKVQEMLTNGNLGIRIIRPTSASARVLNDVSISDAPTTWLADRVIDWNNDSPVDKLRFDIYNGRDRTENSATNTPLDMNPTITFRYDTGDLQAPSYLFSIKDKKNLIHMQSSIGSVELVGVVDSTGENPGSSPTGLDLFEEWVDGGAVSEDLDPSEYTTAMENEARAEYKRRARQAFLDGAISPTAPWKYGSDYYLGDLVTVNGEYGIRQTMQVSEYIRTYDQKLGEKSYPTLIEPPV